MPCSSPSQAPGNAASSASPPSGEAQRKRHSDTHKRISTGPRQQDRQRINRSQRQQDSDNRSATIRKEYNLAKARQIARIPRFSQPSTCGQVLPVSFSMSRIRRGFRASLRVVSATLSLDVLVRPMAKRRSSVALAGPWPVRTQLRSSSKIMSRKWWLASIHPSYCTHSVALHTTRAGWEPAEPFRSLDMTKNLRSLIYDRNYPDAPPARAIELSNVAIYPSLTLTHARQVLTSKLSQRSPEYPLMRMRRHDNSIHVRRTTLSDSCLN